MLSDITDPSMELKINQIKSLFDDIQNKIGYSNKSIIDKNDKNCFKVLIKIISYIQNKNLESEINQYQSKKVSEDLLTLEECFKSLALKIDELKKETLFLDQHIIQV